MNSSQPPLFSTTLIISDPNITLMHN